jgi:CRISPR-associated protein (TIGR03986 family)
MAKGTIKMVKHREGYGFINQDGDDEDVYFKPQWVKDISSHEIRRGLRVEYDTRRTPRGLQTKWVRAIVEQEQSPTELQQKTYRFLNPYNFVRYLGKPTPEPTDDSPEPLLMWRCPPPPHDRYVGLTGCITCTVEAKTPLFISDSHAVEEKPGDHKSYRFFQYDGKPALPASSLRGMVRSAFEAVTNSCYHILGGERLDHRLEPGDALELVPARIEPTENGWKLWLLTGTTRLRVGGTPSGKQYAAWLHRYRPVNPSKTLTKKRNVNGVTREFQERTKEGTEVDLGGLEHGQSCYALLEPRQHPYDKIKFWDVVEVSEDSEEGKEALLRKKRDNQRVERGWLCLNNQNIDRKHSERFFFRASENNRGSESVDLALEVVSRYEELIKGYQKRHKDEVQKRSKQHQPFGEPIEKGDGKELGLSRFIYQTGEKKVRGGELVYAKLRGSTNNPQVESIVPVSIPRVGYEYPIGELLKTHTKHLVRCSQYEKLCPACRVFGWVWDSPPEDADRVAYAGRVRFAHGKARVETLDYEEPIPLAILSTPKPTTTEFYLLDSEGKPDFDVDYDDKGAQLRGRKFYRHHGEADPDEYTSEPSDQNRTVRDALKPGATFTFTVDFENLAPVELGALLYALELEGDLVHRLGYAKPLGFGSVKVAVNGAKRVEDWPTRLQSLDAEAGWKEVGREKVDDLKRDFLQTMRELYGDEFDDKVLSDLKALLGEPPEGLPVHYPRTDEKPDPDGKNYEWFEEHEDEALPLAPHDTQGFSL